MTHFTSELIASYCFVTAGQAIEACNVGYKLFASYWCVTEGQAIAACNSLSAACIVLVCDGMSGNSKLHCRTQRRSDTASDRLCNLNSGVRLSANTACFRHPDLDSTGRNAPKPGHRAARHDMALLALIGGILCKAFLLASLQTGWSRTEDYRLPLCSQ